MDIGSEEAVGTIVVDGWLLLEEEGGRICGERGLGGAEAVGGRADGPPPAHGAFPLPGGLVLDGGGGLLLLAHGATPVIVDGGLGCFAQGATPVTVEGGFFLPAGLDMAQGATPVIVEGGAAPDPLGGRADGGGMLVCRPLLLGGGRQSPIPA